jgi:hypothetical protein
VPNDPDQPYDRSLADLADKPSPENHGTPTRVLRASAAQKQKRAPLPRKAAAAMNDGDARQDAAVIEHPTGRLGDPVQAGAALFVKGNGGETIPAEPDLHAYQPIVRQSPELLAAQATEVRLRQTAAVSDDAMILAVEAAESNAASTAMERDMLHQYAALHSFGMDLLAAGKRFLVTVTPWQPEGRQQLQSIEATRCAVAAAKAFGASQRAAQTWKYLRDGGRQVVTVQHVTVEAGGQAVVAGSVKRRRRGQ